MNKSNIAIVDALKGLLLKTPELVDTFQEKKHASIPVLEKWLQDLEKELKKFNYAQCSEIAGLRGQLIEIKYEPDQNRLSRKKKLLAKGSGTIYPAQSVVQEIIHPLEEKISQARLLMQQVLSIGLQTGIITKPSSKEMANYIQNTWLLLKQHQQLQGGIQNITSLVGPADGMRLLAEEIRFS